MGIPLDQIKDPRTRKRVLEALGSGYCNPVSAAGQSSVSARPRRRLRQDRKPLMNKLEEEYCREFNLKLMSVPLSIQAIRFKLANGLWYKVDFFLWYPRPRGIEVKGPHSFRGGFENLKMAAQQYPWIEWTLVWKENGDWQEQIILP